MRKINYKWLTIDREGAFTWTHKPSFEIGLEIWLDPKERLVGRDGRPYAGDASFFVAHDEFKEQIYRKVGSEWVYKGKQQ